MEKETTLNLTYYDYEDFKKQIGKLVENKDLWNELEDGRKRLEKVEIVIRKERR